MSFNLTVGPNNLLPSVWDTPALSNLFPRELTISEGVIFVRLSDTNLNGSVEDGYVEDGYVQGDTFSVGVALDLAEDTNILFLAVKASE
jgi:hypothetical protein